MNSKHQEPLMPHRVRRPPKEGFSWIDRRFLREHAEALGHDAITLYFFLAAVSNRHGLSYYGDASISGRLRISPEDVMRAREELERFDLITYEAPLYQVLTLPQRRRRATPHAGGSPQSLGDVLRSFDGSPRP